MWLNYTIVLRTHATHSLLNIWLNVRNWKIYRMYFVPALFFIWCRYIHSYNLYSVKYNLKWKHEKNQSFHVEGTGTSKEFYERYRSDINSLHQDILKKQKRLVQSCKRKTKCKHIKLGYLFTVYYLPLTDFMNIRSLISLTETRKKMTGCLK